MTRVSTRTAIAALVVVGLAGLIAWAWPVPHNTIALSLPLEADWTTLADPPATVALTARWPRWLAPGRSHTLDLELVTENHAAVTAEYNLQLLAEVSGAGISPPGLQQAAIDPAQPLHLHYTLDPGAGAQTWRVLLSVRYWPTDPTRSAVFEQPLWAYTVATEPAPVFFRVPRWLWLTATALALPGLLWLTVRRPRRLQSDP